ncbi:hypothetical protein EVAR_482_1 [Eumeta japonica]|uniref:Uncharacterized protein n=1 Tax=Eumeta variegata TaxID=151549 RepID=A0A4C1SDA4_EUMVA|nr:hypothetical protein EVAR_482_1 [Eumeta japonica]
MAEQCGRGAVGPIGPDRRRRWSFYYFYDRHYFLILSSEVFFLVVFCFRYNGTSESSARWGNSRCDDVDRVKMIVINVDEKAHRRPCTGYSTTASGREIDASQVERLGRLSIACSELSFARSAQVERDKLSAKEMLRMQYGNYVHLSPRNGLNFDGMLQPSRWIALSYRALVAQFSDTYGVNQERFTINSPEESLVIDRGRAASSFGYPYEKEVHFILEVSYKNCYKSDLCGTTATRCTERIWRSVLGIEVAAARPGSRPAARRMAALGEQRPTEKRLEEEEGKQLTAEGEARLVRPPHWLTSRPDLKSVVVV